MKRTILLLLFSLLASASFSFANTVTYNTSLTTFNCSASSGFAGCGSQSLTIGNILSGDALVLTYIPTTVTSLDASPSSFTNLGRILVSCYNGGTTCSGQALAGASLAITILQTDVSATSESYQGMLALGILSGSIGGQYGLGQITWQQGNSIQSNGTLFNVTYSVVNNPLALTYPSNNNCSSNPCEVLPGPAGETTIQGLVNIAGQTPPVTPDTPLPEPATCLLLASGLIGFGLIRRRG